MARRHNLADNLRRAARARPEVVALGVAGGEDLTYGDWLARSEALAAGLQQREVHPGDRVVLCFAADRWVDYAVACLAVHTLAGVVVTVPAGTGPTELAGVAGDCDAAAVLAAPRVAASVAADPAEVEADGRDRGLALPKARLDPAELHYRWDRLARPAPMARSHEAVMRPSPYTDGAGHEGHAATLVHTFAPGTLQGQHALRACLQPVPLRGQVAAPFDPSRVAALLTDADVTTLALHPVAAAGLLAAGATGSGAPGLQRLVLAGGHPTGELLVGLAQAFADVDVRLVDVLGAGEVPTVFTYDHRRPAALGRPVQGTVAVVDPAGQPVGAGQAGEVRLRAGSAWLGTSRVGCVDEQGCLYTLATSEDVTMRSDGAVVPAEVGAVLRAHPALADAAAVAATAVDGGVVAAVVARADVSESELRAWLRDRLDEHKLPDRVAFVGAVPRNAAGELLAAALRRHLGVAVPTPADEQPDDPTEQAVAAVWRRVLGRRVSRHDDFFEQGGSGVAATRVLSLVDDALGVPVPLAEFLAEPTVAGLAAAVRRHASREREAADEAPVAVSQLGMLWHEQLAPGCQNLPGLARRFRGPLDVAALADALAEIVRRHEPLRSRFELRHGRLVQTVMPHRPQPLVTRDLANLAPADRDAQMQRLVDDAGHRPFDLAGEALFQPTLLRLADDDHVLLIRTHHTVFDDWSVGVFRRELAELYEAFAAGAASPLPELPVGFVEAVREQRRQLAGRAGARQMAHWRRELDGAPLACQLPIDDPDLPAGSPQPSGGPVSVQVPAAVHHRLRRLADEQRATVFMTLLTAFGVLVQRYTGQDDLMLATVVANRNRTEHEPLIGCFTKKVPVRLRLAGDPPFVDALARAREALLGALTNQDLPFEEIVQGTLGSGAAAHGLAPHLAVMFQGEAPKRELELADVDSAGFATSATATRTHFAAGDPQRPAGAAEPPWGDGLYQGTFLIVSVAEADAGVTVTARGAFHPPAVRDLLGAYTTLLDDVAAHPDRRVSELSVVSEQQAAAMRPGPTAAAHPGGHVPAGRFDTHARDTPRTVAVVTGQAAITFGELRARVERLGRRLRAVGVAPGAIVGLALPASVDAVVAALAVWHSGAAWTGLDPGDDPDRLARTLEQAGVAVVIGDNPQAVLAQRTCLLPTHGAENGAAATSPPATIDASAPAVVWPDGTVASHHAVARLADALADIGAADGKPGAVGWLSCPPARNGFLRQLALLLAGYPLRMPARGVADDPGETLSLVRHGSVDVLDCSPAELDALVPAGLAQAVQGRPAGGVQPTIVVGISRPIGPSTWQVLRTLPARCHLLYGPSRTAFAASRRTVREGPDRPTLGMPLPGVGLHVLDRHGQPAPTRALGELHVAAPALEPTGQLARRLPGGDVELVSGDELRGFRVDPQRVQAALASHPDVRDVDVRLERDGEPRLVASVSAAGSAPSLAQLRAWLWARRPGYAWPSRLVDATSAPGATAGAAALATAWAEELGVVRIAGDESYWQLPSFLDALRRAREAGLAIPSSVVGRNRTLAMLGAAITAPSRTV